MDNKLEKTKEILKFEKQTIVSGQSYKPIITAEDEVIIESLEEVCFGKRRGKFRVKTYKNTLGGSRFYCLRRIYRRNRVLSLSEDHFSLSWF